MDGVGTKSSLRLALGFSWSSWVSLPGSTFCSLPLSTLFFFGQNINLCVSIFRYLDRYGCIITPQLLLSQWPCLSLVTRWFQFSKCSALSRFLLKERRPTWSNYCRYSDVPCAVCVWKLPVLAKSYWLFPLQGCSIVTLQIPAVSRFCKVKHFMWVHTHAPLCLYIRLARGIYFIEAICFCDTWFRWLSSFETEFEWPRTSNFTFVWGLCFTLENNVFHATLKCLLLTWLTLYLDPS